MHHNALEDARAAAEIVLHACAATNTDVEDWLKRVEQPIFPSEISRKRYSSHPTPSINREGNPEGVLFGEIVVFIGSLTIPRREAADMVAETGCKVIDSVSKKVTMHVVGIQDEEKLNGYSKSSKHRIAEALINDGATIQILSEQDFFELLRIK